MDVFLQMWLDRGGLCELVWNWKEKQPLPRAAVILIFFFSS